MKFNCPLLLYTDSDGSILSRKPAPAPLAKEIDFQPGKAHYLGDFFAASTFNVSWNTINRQWEIKRTRDDYEVTTEQMKKDYPAFEKMPTEKKLLGG